MRNGSCKIDSIPETFSDFMKTLDSETVEEIYDELRAWDPFTKRRYENVKKLMGDFDGKHVYRTKFFPRSDFSSILSFIEREKMGTKWFLSKSDIDFWSRRKYGNEKLTIVLLDGEIPRNSIDVEGTIISYLINDKDMIVVGDGCEIHLHGFWNDDGSFGSLVGKDGKLKSVTA